MAQRSKSYLIDVHQHNLPPFYKTILDDLDIHHLVGATPIRPTTPQDSLELMDKNGIAASMFMITGWSIYSTSIARRNNEYWAKVIQDYPGRFAAYGWLHFFPDVEGALKEAEYSLDQLKLDGVSVLSSIQGHYLSDPEYGELLAELNRRKAVVAIHCSILPDEHPRFPPVHPPEFGLDVFRIVARLTGNGIFDRYPDIRWLIPFNIPGLPLVAGGFASRDEAKIAALKRQYYTIMGNETPLAIRALQEFFGPSHLLWASDFGIGGNVAAGIAAVSTRIKGLRQYDEFDEKTRALVEHGNAIALFPRLKARLKV